MFVCACVYVCRSFLYVFLWDLSRAGRRRSVREGEGESDGDEASP